MDNGLTHKIADCQAQDGSVQVEWQECEDEGTPNAVEGVYPSLRAALAAHPDAVPVCPGCSPRLEKGKDHATHAGGVACEDGVETFLS